jgi:hypothetical protein
MNPAGIVNLGRRVVGDFVGLGKNITENTNFSSAVTSALNVVGVLAGTAIPTIYGTLWFCKNIFPQEAELTKKAAEPAQKAAEPVKSETVKKYYVMKVAEKPVQKAAPVQAVQNCDVQTGAKKSSQEAVKEIMDKLQESYPGMAFEVKYQSPVALAGADADTV